MSPRKKKIEESRSEITVIVPVLNRPEMVTRCLESIRRQSWRPLDVIVVDNGSKDSTPEAVRNFIDSIDEDDLNVRLVYHTVKGAPRARNHGVRVATTPYILFFDSDDEMHPELVSEAMRKFHEDPVLDIVHWKCRCIDENGRTTYKRYSESNYWERHIYNCMLSTQSYAIRRNFLDYCGGWNESLRCWDDWELGVRLLCHSPRVAGIPKVLVDIHLHADSITGRDFSSGKGEWEMAIDESENDVDCLIANPEERKRLRKMLAYVRVVLGARYRKEGSRNEAQWCLHQALRRRYYLDSYNDRMCPRSESRRLLSLGERLLFRSIYLYTRLGGRGAYRLLR